MAPTPRDIARLAGVHPKLVTVILGILRDMPMFVVEGVRTAERQHSIYVLHPEATTKDGYVHKSNHQPHSDGLGYAVDCAFVGPDPFALTHDWKGYGGRLEAQGCIWGGRWHKPVDLDHAELPDPALGAVLPSVLK